MATDEPTLDRDDFSSLPPADPDEPYRLFARWFAEAQAFPIAQPEAVTLATVDADGPDARTVLMRGVDHPGRRDAAGAALPDGFRFYTNYHGAKGRALAAEPSAAMLFHWEPLARQVRIRGQVMRLSADESDAYFRSRPRLSQLGAWASPQSDVIESRGWLEARVHEIEARFAGADVPRPPHWGGFRLVPTSLELWQGRDGRLHDRLRYRRCDTGWLRERLAP